MVLTYSTVHLVDCFIGMVILEVTGHHKIFFVFFYDYYSLQMFVCLFVWMRRSNCTYC